MGTGVMKSGRGRAPNQVLAGFPVSQPMVLTKVLMGPPRCSGILGERAALGLPPSRSAGITHNRQDNGILRSRCLTAILGVEEYGPPALASGPGAVGSDEILTKGVQM